MFVGKTGFVASSAGGLESPCFPGRYEVRVGRLLFDGSAGVRGGAVDRVDGFGEGFILKEGAGT